MLSTIGYEGATLSDFIRTLKASGIEVLIDVRERAQSRRRGFSKSSLAESLDAVGIEYTHFRELGDPKEGREAARSGNIAEFRQIYRNVLKRKNAQAAMDEIIDIIDAQSACLMCYERDPMTCHRKMITDKIQQKTGVNAKHLGVNSIESSTSARRRVFRAGQGAAA